MDVVFAELRTVGLSVRLLERRPPNHPNPPRKEIVIEPDGPHTRRLSAATARILGETLLRYADALEGHDLWEG